MNLITKLLLVASILIAAASHHVRAQNCYGPTLTSGQCTSMSLGTPLLMMCDNCGWIQYGNLSQQTKDPSNHPMSYDYFPSLPSQYFGNTVTWSLPCYFVVQADQCENCDIIPCKDSWQYDSMETTCCSYTQVGFNVPYTWICWKHGLTKKNLLGACPYNATMCQAP